ncbi:SDR family NAD(P)-dependent oxidoreductase [Microbacterium sp. YJN-G]|uniref:SDR family NAD(P)-dependent oxidoreductase n=1 Tax=Microbacterium sp. YJN-G TaxID=2763257 RepID=UPI001878DADD|nr:SDR family oxidoreductase [Microbacterium sp. YJN-G]
MTDDFSADLSGRTAVVTGASSGIGAAIAELFLANGATVIGLQRRPDDRQHPRYRSRAVDLGDTAGLDAVVADVLAESRVDILVNNAGLNIRHPFEDFPAEDWDRVLDVNLTAVVRLAQGFGRPMLERGDGIVINLASMLSFFGGFTASAYAASKGAVGQFTKSLANEWAGRGVRVNAIAPGFIATEMNTALMADETRDRQIRERIPAGRWGAADDIAGAALFLASGASRYVHGAVIPVDGGYLGR